MSKNKIIIFSILLILFFMGSATAATHTNEKSGIQIKSTSNIDLKTPTDKIVAHGPNRNIKLTNGCCSVLVHVKEGHDVFAFRRDSTYAANLYFLQKNWYGKDTLIEYKTANGYFFHTIIAKDGWIASEGGPDIPYLNQQLEDLAGRTSVSGKITSSTINSAISILRRLGMGHFLIKAPNGDVGLVLHNGWTKTALFNMKSGQYVSVPNHPSYYRNGFVSTENPVSSTINLALSDGWGVNRRDILTYEVKNEIDIINYSTSVNVWASRTRSSDNLYFGGQIIRGSSLPRAPNKTNIGQLILKSNDTLPEGIYGGLYSLRK